MQRKAASAVARLSVHFRRTFPPPPLRDASPKSPPRCPANRPATRGRDVRDWHQQTNLWR